MPKKIDDSSWWYEDKHGIDIVVEPTDRTVQKRIGWSALLKAAARCRPELFNPSLLRAAKFLAMEEREQVAQLDKTIKANQEVLTDAACNYLARAVLAAILGRSEVRSGPTTGRGKRGRK